MRMFGCFIKSSLLALTSTIGAFAQTATPYPPQALPVPPPTGMPAPAPTATNTSPYPAPPNPYQPQPYNQPAPPPGYPYPPPAPQAIPGSPSAPGVAPPPAWQPGTPAPMTVDVNASAAPGIGGTGTSQSEAGITETGAPSTTNNTREYSLYRHNSLSGATGLLHTISADSAAPGTFRIALTSSYFLAQDSSAPMLRCVHPHQLVSQLHRTHSTGSARILRCP